MAKVSFNLSFFHLILSHLILCHHISFCFISSHLILFHTILWTGDKYKWTYLMCDDFYQIRRETCSFPSQVTWPPAFRVRFVYIPNDVTILETMFIRLICVEIVQGLYCMSYCQYTINIKIQNILDRKWLG